MGFQKGPRDAIQIQRIKHQRTETVDGKGIAACPEQRVGSDAHRRTPRGNV